MNSFTFTGNVGKEPEVRFSPSGTCVIAFSVGVAHPIKKDGQTAFETDWVNCTMFGKKAESVAEKLHKGAPVIATGRYVQEKYTDKQGQNRVMFKCYVDEIGILISRPSKRQETQPQGYPMTQQQAFSNMGQTVDEPLPF